MKSLKNGKCVHLKFLERPLNFLFKKGYEPRELRKNVSNNTESEVSLRGTFILGCTNNSQNPSDPPFRTVPTSLHPAARAWLLLVRFWRTQEKLCVNRSSSLLNMQSLHVAKILVLNRDLIAVRLVPRA